MVGGFVVAAVVVVVVVVVAVSVDRTVPWLLNNVLLGEPVALGRGNGSGNTQLQFTK